MNKIAKYLNQHMVGNVFDKPSIREAYATDRSALKIMPRFVAVPANVQDVRKIVRFANQVSLKGLPFPLTVRGGGQSKTGASLGSGMIISMEKLNKIQEIDARGRLVRVQAGVTLGELNTALALHGLRLPVAGSPKETIGGLIASCPEDIFLAKHGGIMNFVEQVEFITSSGDFCQTGRLSARTLAKCDTRQSFESKIYRNLQKIISSQGSIIKSLKNQPLNFAGYHAITKAYRFENGSLDLMPLLCGSEGTLGIITEVILRAELVARKHLRILTILPNLNTAIPRLEKLAKLEPLSLNIYEMEIFEKLGKQGKGNNSLLKELNAGSYAVVIEFDERSIWKQARKLAKTKEILSNLPVEIENEKTAEAFDEIEYLISAYLNDEAEGERIAFADNVMIPANRLEGFVTALKEQAESLKIKLPIFGSFSNNIYHVRPEVDIESVLGRQFLLKFLKNYLMIVKENEGMINGRSSEGRVKGILVNTSIDDPTRKLYSAIKTAFDPNAIFNPELKTGIDIKKTVRAIRTNVRTGIIEQ